MLGIELLEKKSKKIRKEAIAMKVDGNLTDLSEHVKKEAEVEFILPNTEDGLDIIRHDGAHILAQAVKELYPNTQITIGPTIKEGFYYDFARDEPFTEKDLPIIEKKMQEIIDQNITIKKKEIPRNEAIEFFEKQKEYYKVELIKELPKDEKITIYTQGNFSDLCKGPHAPSTNKVKAFKLLKIAGAYWRGDSSREMLQRIYGTAWASKKQLNDYLLKIEEAEKRDHRKLAKAMNLFHFSDNAPGAIFWHSKGWDLFQTLVNFIRNKQTEKNYIEVSTPEILDKSLWEKSGHWEKFGENMFTVSVSNEEKTYAVRPMNCPGGVEIFNQGIKSYRDLPLRIAEFGKVYRYEPSGALHGLMRARAFTQDDAHIFCTEEQMKQECINVCKLIIDIYKSFGFEDVKVKFSDRPEKRIGSDKTWDKAESSLLEAINAQNLNYTLNPGEGAFYGPKIEFVLRDAIGRDWQLGTLQVDLNLPLRLGARYIGKDGQKYQPVMLHRALFGSIERFLGILLEHYSGNLPLWLSPVQIVIATITEEVKDYAISIKNKLSSLGIKCILDLENEKITYKIRKHSIAKTSIIGIIGAKEVQNNTISIRKLGKNSQETLELKEFIDKLLIEVQPPE